MFSFFQNILNPGGTSCKDQATRLYFDTKHHFYIDIQINPRTTCEEINAVYSLEIISAISKLKQKFQSSNDFAFIVAYKGNSNTCVKLRHNHRPLAFLKSRQHMLCYLNVESKRESPKAQASAPSDPRQGRREGRGFRSLVRGELIREGEIKKFSHKMKKFTKRYLLLDQEKLVISNDSEKDCLLLFLGDILTIKKSDMLKDFIFEITMIDGDVYIFNSKCLNDMDNWIEGIYDAMNNAKDQRTTAVYQRKALELIKDIYTKEISIINSCFTVKGAVALDETRVLLLRRYRDDFLGDIVENYLKYQKALKGFKLKDAYDSFTRLYELVRPEFQLESYESLFGIDKANRMSCNSSDGNLQNKFSCKTVKSKTSEDQGSNGGSRRNLIVYNKHLNDVYQRGYDDRAELAGSLEGNLVDSYKSAEFNGLSQGSSDLESVSPISLRLIGKQSDTPEAIYDESHLSKLKGFLKYDTLKKLVWINKELKQSLSLSDKRLKPLLYSMLKPHIFHELFSNIIERFYGPFFKEINPTGYLFFRNFKILTYYYRLKNNLSKGSFISKEDILIGLILSG